MKVSTLGTGATALRMRAPGLGPQVLDEPSQDSSFAEFMTALLIDFLVII